MQQDEGINNLNLSNIIYMIWYDKYLRWIREGALDDISVAMGRAIYQEAMIQEAMGVSIDVKAIGQGVIEGA